MFWSSKMEKAVKAQQYKGFIIEKKPKSIAAEAYRTLRTNIQYSSFDKQIKTIVVTSAEAAEGKSTVSGNLALCFAQNEKKVIIVDCDLRKPSVHKNFQISNLIGLSEVLIGKEQLEEAIQRRNENLDMLPSGKIPPNPSEMLSSSAMTNIIEALREKYDVVILDGTPCNLVSDSIPVSRIVDTTIIVAESRKTKIEDLVPLCANCHRKKAKVLSIEKLQKIIQKVRTSKKVCQVH